MVSIRLLKLFNLSTSYGTENSVDMSKQSTDGSVSSHYLFPYFIAPKRGVFNLPVCSFLSDRPNIQAICNRLSH